MKNSKYRHAWLLVVLALLLVLAGCNGTGTTTTVPPVLNTSPSSTALAPATPTTSASPPVTVLPSSTTAPTTQVITDTTTPPPPRDISVADAHAWIEQTRGRPDFILLDVRTPAEYAAGHIEGAVNVDYEAADFRDRVDKLERVKTYLVYCQTGVRSAAASEVMVEFGFHYVENMLGGITEWQAAGYPVIQ